MTNKSLAVYSKKRLPKIMLFFKKLFSRTKQVDSKLENNIENNIGNKIKEVDPLDDFEVLKKIIENKVLIKDIDNETKSRLIGICQDRLVGVRNQIEDKKNEIKKMEQILVDVNAL